MARGRFLSDNLGSSRKFAALPNDTARLLYVLLLPKTDANGRVDGDPIWIKGQVLTRLATPTKEIEASLAALHDVGLINWYEVDGERYLEITDFFKHNKIRPEREAAPKIPPPSGVTQESLQSHSAVAPAQEKEQEQVEVEVEVQAEALALRADPLPAPAAFLSVWEQHRGNLPACQVLNDKRRRGFDALKREHGAEALALFEAATRHVAADDFWVQKGYGLDNLLRPGRVLEKAEKFAAHGSMSAGDRKLATTASVIARAIRSRV